MMLTEYSFQTLYRDHEERLTAELEQRRMQEERLEEEPRVAAPSGVLAALTGWRPFAAHPHAHLH
ncbi:hypothetical protein HQQ80_20715 [Microbacteriaceae bacterium VKM Ac-2855]|nr:hypothetical protein [Microbacteriaceae bacterium VKM Ac-2855]